MGLNQPLKINDGPQASPRTETPTHSRCFWLVCSFNMSCEARGGLPGYSAWAGPSKSRLPACGSQSRRLVRFRPAVQCFYTGTSSCGSRWVMPGRWPAYRVFDVFLLMLVDGLMTDVTHKEMLPEESGTEERSFQFVWHESKRWRRLNSRSVPLPPPPHHRPRGTCPCTWRQSP